MSGHMPGDADMIGDLSLTPIINSAEQLLRHIEALPNSPFGVQLDTGMNRLGMEAGEWAGLAEIILGQKPNMVMSHLACADEPSHEMNRAQLRQFHDLTDGINVPRSLAATGGLLLGKDYHFDIARPGIGLYGGHPFDLASPVIQLSLPVIQTRELAPGETVGYSNTFTASAPMRVATVSAGYADGLPRVLSSVGTLYYGETPCPILGRVSMDLITVDVTHLTEQPATLDIIGPEQPVDTLADAAGTIGYEILTSLGARYTRRYIGG
jgi:alanine racemase